MAHLTSAPALRTAREIMKAYSMEVVPPAHLKTGRLDGLTNSEKHVATLIDHATNVHEVVKLRPEFHHWQRHLIVGAAEAPQIAAFLARVSEALSRVPRRLTSEAPMISTFKTCPEVNMKDTSRELSKFSIEVARVLFYYYHMTPNGRPSSDIFDRQNVAQIVEVCLGLTRIMKVEGAFVRMRTEVSAGHVTREEVIKFMRAMGILFDRLPSYENREEEVMILA